MTPQQRWNAANPEKLRSASQKYYAAHREQAHAATRRYQVANPEKVRAAQKRRYDSRRVFIARWKLAAGCIDCGYNANAEALDFDHVQGNKHFSIGSEVLRGWKTLLAEIEKCVVRCANCHRVATRTRRK
jgi:hypothetical protein